MIRTTCPKCGREDAVADYLAMLPIMCNGCGTRLTIGEKIAANPLFPPPVAPPPKAAPPPPKPAPPPPLPKAKRAAPPPPVEANPTPAEPPSPPESESEPGAFVAPSPVVITAETPPAESPPVALDRVPAPPPEIPPARPVAPPPVVKVPRAAKAPPVAPPPPEAPFPLPLAGVGRRLLARFLFLLGLALMVGLGFGVLMIVPKSVTRDAYIMWAIVAAFPLIYLLVNAAMLARTGQDVGKRYAGVRVVNADGSPATQTTALLKRDALTFVIGLTGIGVLYWLADFVTLFGKGGRCLHDRIAGTRVVRA